MAQVPRRISLRRSRSAVEHSGCAAAPAGPNMGRSRSTPMSRHALGCCRYLATTASQAGGFVRRGAHFRCCVLLTGAEQLVGETKKYERWRPLTDEDRRVLFAERA